MQLRVLHTQHKRYLDRIDSLSRTAAEKLATSEQVSGFLLKIIRAIYYAAKAESDYTQNDVNFEVAYHSPVTGDIEFLFARILYHFSDIEGLGVENLSETTSW